jgi:hypothetical protein
MFIYFMKFVCHNLLFYLKSQTCAFLLLKSIYKRGFPSQFRVALLPQKCCYGLIVNFDYIKLNTYLLKLLVNLIT